MAKITFKNGSSIAFYGTDSPEAGRGKDTRILETYNDWYSEYEFSFDQTMKKIVSDKALSLLEVELDRAMEVGDINKAHKIVDLQFQVMGLYPPPEKMFSDDF